MAYTWLRYLPWVDALLESDPDEAMRRIAWLSVVPDPSRPFRDELTAGMPPCPEDPDEKARILGVDAASLTPGWFSAECFGADRDPLRRVLLSRAPLWLRLQSDDPQSVLAELDSLGVPWSRSELVPGAIRIGAGSDISRAGAYLEGHVEVQDAGSQRVLLAAGVEPGGRWLDACAGAGGKTLQLACLVGPGGRVTARDPREAALRELSARAERAGLSRRIEVGGGDPQGGFDGVLVDAPCTGTGTWRRAPHLRWCTDGFAVSGAASVQLSILSSNAARVRRGGVLVYATCSLCRSENEGVAERFLEKSAKFEPLLPGRVLPPQEHDGDGFFVAAFRRRA
jgi:16S rRNA (cytosine967-C5)-methyltransferase